MSRDRRHTTALVERIARVREMKVQQELAHATTREHAQRVLTEASGDCLRSTERRLASLLMSKRLDLSRAGLYQDLACAQQSTLAGHQKTLEEREGARAMCATDLARKTHYRDGATRRACAAVKDHRIAEEHRQAEGLIDAWVLRRIRGAAHE